MPNDQITQTTWQNEPDDWENAGTAPSSDLRSGGFRAGYKPPAAVFNRLFYKFRVVIAEIHSVITTMQQETASYFSSVQTALSGKANASHTHDDRYYTETEVDTFLSGKAASVHTHDDRYYTENEINTKLGEKAALSHLHDDRYYTENEVDTLLSSKQDTLQVDTELDPNSSNPVRNSVIAAAIGNKANASHSHDDRYYTENEVDAKLLGKAASSHTHDDRYYTENEVDTKLGEKAALSHSHDDRYYTENEVDTKLSGKAAASHTHDDRYYTESEVDTKLSGKQDVITIDTALDSNSPNPVKNSAISAALANKANAAHSHDDRYYTESEIDTKLSGKAASSHNHDSRYYTESEIDTKLSGKAASSHTHDDRYYTESEIDAKLAGIFANATYVTDATTDLNTFKTGGVYSIWVNDGSPLHSPAVSSGLHLLLVMTTGSYGVQILFVFGQSTGQTGVYVRSFFSTGTFQEWGKL